MAEAFFPTTPIPHTPPPATKSVFGDDIVSDTAQQNTEFKRQCCLYAAAVLSEGPIRDGLAWWRKRQSEFPLVAFVPRSILSAQASSAETERLFSAGGRIVSRFRTRLTGSRTEKLVVLSKDLREFLPTPIDDNGYSSDDEADSAEPSSAFE